MLRRPWSNPLRALARGDVFARGDLFVAGVVLVVGQLNLWTASDVPGPRPAFAVAAALAALVLAVRRSRPLTVLFAVVVAASVPSFVWAPVQLFSFVLPLAVSVFAVGRYAPRPRAYLAVPVGIGAVVLQEWLDPTQTVSSGWAWSLWIPAVLALGIWASQQHELAERRESAALEQARSAAAEERLRLARELHDVLTHGISVMVVQAEAAEEMLPRDPGRAEAAIRAVQDAGRAALRETRGLVTTLRAVDELPPTVLPDLAALPDLLASVRAAGLEVTVAGSAPTASTAASVPADAGAGRAVVAVPAEVGAVAYRVVQESLTNVLRHAGGAPCHLRIAPEADGLVVDVRNEGPLVEPRPWGNGLSGMAERVAAVGGTLEAGPRAGGGFQVRAWLPTFVGAPTSAEALPAAAAPTLAEATPAAAPSRAVAARRDVPAPAAGSDR